MSGNITAEVLIRFGPFISGIGIFFGFILAVVNVTIVRRQEKIDSISEAYSILYREFWKDGEIAPVRRAIINIREYPPYERILKMRNFTPLNDLSPEDNDYLDTIDKFCSMLVRLKSMEESYMPHRQRLLWNKTLNGEVWLDRINQRHEFRRYIEKCWPELITPIPWYKRL